ncbi:helix-turn-helix domain-containing protein [Flavobacterium chuncheonense]|uniref:Helix-turn-helix domain-containing protein n=1 Tax=Flavobacterium chuncheonense TaxID=2026653 RepID=A0ABW5YLD4_9FLAO
MSKRFLFLLLLITIGADATQASNNLTTTIIQSSVSTKNTTETKEAIEKGKQYLASGIKHYQKKELKKALDNYLIAYEYFEYSDDYYTIHKIEYAIAQTKYYLGFYEEAIKSFKQCLLYFETENDRAYLNVLHHLGLCYNKSNDFETCTLYNTKGIKEGQRLRNSEMEPYFKHSEAINQYFKKNYSVTINELQKVIPFLKQKNDFANEAVANFYIAKSYWQTNQKEEALPYLLKVDNTFSTNNYIRPDLRENFELLIKYYEIKKEVKKQLIYTNKLLKADSILNSNYKYLSNKIFKVYDTKKLYQAKAELEKQGKLKNIFMLLIALVLTTFIILLGIKYKKKLYINKEVSHLIIKANNPTNARTLEQKSNKEETEINPVLEEAILKNLEKFEVQKRYLQKDMTLPKIASYLKTNTKYAAKTILKHRGKKTIDYINDLKVEHIIELLKNENKYRNYTIKALAEEAGFGSTQNFTRAFKNKTNSSPSNFIQELNNCKAQVM